MPLGNPIRKQNESRIISVLATEGQSVFTVEGGYIINQISVFRNGVRLSNSEDFTAGDGSTVTLNDEANVDDRIEFHVFDRFTVNNSIVGAASSQTISGDLVINGKIFGNLDVPSINTGIVTTTELDLNGKGDISGDLNVTGVTTVGKQIHVGTGVSIAAGGLNVTAGISTFQAVQGTTGTFTSTVKSGTTATGIIFSAGDSGTSGDRVIQFKRAATTNDINIQAINSGSGATNLLFNQEGGAASFGGAVSATTGTFTGDVDIASDIMHTGDTNNRIRFGTAHQVFITNAVERVRITSDGDVGIGTATVFADSKVHIYDSSATNYRSLVIDSSATNGSTMIYKQNGSQVLAMGSGGGNVLSGSDLTHGLIRSEVATVFAVGNSEKLRITSSGNVGINETTPEAKFEVDGRIRVLDNNDASPSTGKGLEISYFNTADYADILSYDRGGSAYKDLYLRGNNLVFKTGTSERLRITSGGLVGISETNPQALLHLNDGANSTIMLGNTTNGYKIRANVTGSNDYGLLIEDEDGVDLYRVTSSTGTSNANTHSFFTSGSERLRITSGGDVVVNDTTADGNVHPDTKLHVKGGITFRELTSASETALPAITQWSSTGTGQDLVIGARSNNGVVLFYTGNTGTDGDWGASSNAERLRIASDGDVDVATGHLQSQDIKIGLASDKYPIIQRAVQSSGSQNLSITGGSGYSEHSSSNHTVTDAREGALITLGGGDPTSDVYGGYIRYYAAGHTAPSESSSSHTGNQHVFYTRTAADTNTEQFRIKYDGRIVYGGGVQKFYASFYLQNNQSYNWDIPVKSEGGSGNSQFVVMGYNHFHSTAYGAHRVTFTSSRGTTVSAQNLLNQTSGNAGSWVVSKPNNGIYRIEKTAGTYTGYGWGFIEFTTKL